MSRAMGSSCVFTCWGAASWHGGRVMLVFGARAAAGAGSCAGGGAPFGVVVVCGCKLVAVLAGGVAPVCGSGCGWWWVLSWRELARSLSTYFLLKVLHVVPRDGYVVGTF